MNYEASGQLERIIGFSKNKNKTYWVCLAVINNNDKYKIIGNINFMPEVGDYITANGLYDKNNYSEICLNNSNIIIELPKECKSIHKRLCNIYSDQIDKTLDDNSINILSNTKNIWTLLNNRELKQNIDNSIKLDDNIYNYLYEQYNQYMSDRVDCEYQKFDNFLRTNNIKLNSKQIKNLLEKYILAQTIINIIINKDDDYTILELLDVESIGMKTLLNICDALNMNDNKKINIFIINSLLNNAEGHSCLKIDELQNILFNDCNTYKIKYKNFDDNIKNLENKEYIYLYENYIYAKKYYEAETKISKYLVNLSKSNSVLQEYYLDANNYIDNNDYLIDKEKRANNNNYNNHALNDQQKEACMQMFKHNFCINTGKAGTGKSVSLMIPLLFFDKYYKNDISILCLSPTGKACVRLNNEFQKPEYNLHHTAYTIHKFNYYKYSEKNSNEDFDNIIDKKSEKINLIIIDEFSMVDLLTFYTFIKKIKNLPNVCLVLLGDDNQLPSVSVGNILNRLIKSNIFAVVKLTEVVRADGGIVTMSNNVLDCLPLFNNINDNKFVNWIQINPEDENNNKIILDNIKSVNNPLILSTTNKLIKNLHENIKLTLNPILDISECIFKLKSDCDKKYLSLINNLESELITYKKCFDDRSIYNDRNIIYEFISNESKQKTNIWYQPEITNTLKEYFDSKNFSLKNITNYLNTVDTRRISTIIKEFKNNYCEKFNKINQIFNSIKFYENNKNYDYLFNTFNNDFNDNFELDYKYRLYDKIMITKNKYEKDLMNGMIGEIIKFNNFEKELTIKFDNNKEIILSDDDFENIKLAFAITIHKSQGSEGDNVFILVNDSKLNTINLLYTAITRSKSTCIIIGTYEVIESIIKNKKFVKRNSNIHKFCQHFLTN